MSCSRLSPVRRLGKSSSMLSCSEANYERAHSDLEGDSLSLPEDSEDPASVPASSSPLSSSPLLATPPEDIQSYASPSQEDKSPTLQTTVSMEQQVTASSLAVYSTRITAITSADTSAWTKESHREDLLGSDCQSSSAAETLLVDECAGTSDHSSFASRLHNLLLVAQRERLANGADSTSSWIDDDLDIGSTARVMTPHTVAPANVAAEVADSPDYWSYFPESTSVALSCDDDSTDSSSLGDASSSAYSYATSHSSAAHGSNNAYIPSSDPCTDPGLAKTTLCTPVVSRKRTLDSAYSPVSVRHSACDFVASPADQEKPRIKRVKRESIPDTVPTRSNYFSRGPSLIVAAKQRAIEETDGNTAEFLPRRRMYAHRAASLRRTDSLRSEAASLTRGPSKSEIKAEDSEDESWTADTPYSYVPTEPATPVAAGARTARRRALPRSPSTPPRSPMPVPLPIVAPPPFCDFPSPPLNEDDAAERRIRVLMQREAEERKMDGLAERGEATGDAAVASEGAARVERKETEVEVERRIVLNERGRPTSADGSSETPQSIFALTEEPGLCIDENIHAECIDWILEVLPDLSNNPTQVRRQLHAQLQESLETRWHAAQIFTRYFHRLGSARSRTASPASALGRHALTEDALLAHEGREVATWDCAVACVALSVKFQRDVFLPNYMIPAREFGALAPHSMSFDDLETAQRDIFDALSHSLGSATPGQYLQDFWIALPSLRGLLAFDGGWTSAQEQTWAILLEAFMQPDILRFPTSLITACALIDGSVDVLVERYKATLCASRAGSSGRRPSTGAGKLIRRDRETNFRRKATKAVLGVKMDLQELLGYSEADVRYCRFWLRSAP